MTSVWIRTINRNYFNVEKIRNVWGSKRKVILDKRQYNVYVEIGSDRNPSIYEYNYIKNEVAPDSTVNIEHVIRWIYKAKILASERNEAIFLDFNKDFENPIVED